MYQQPVYRIGILNTKNGKIVKEAKIVDDQIYLGSKREILEDVLAKAREISEWFDDKDTFFTGKPLWEHWTRIGFVERIKSLLEGKALSNVICESIAVFEDNKGIEHEFFVEKIERR